VDEGSLARRATPAPHADSLSEGAPFSVRGAGGHTAFEERDRTRTERCRLRLALVDVGARPAEVTRRRAVARSVVVLRAV
jgi:hypothetical protein